MTARSPLEKKLRGAAVAVQSQQERPMIAIHGHSLRKTNRKRSRAIPKQSPAAIEEQSNAVDYIHSKEFESKAADSAIIRESKRISTLATETEKLPRASGNQAYFAGL